MFHRAIICRLAVIGAVLLVGVSADELVRRLRERRAERAAAP